MKNQKTLTQKLLQEVKRILNISSRQLACKFSLEVLEMDNYENGKKELSNVTLSHIANETGIRLIDLSEKEHSFELPIHNMYGTVTVSRLKNGLFCMSLDDEVGEMNVGISEEFYNAVLKEFMKAKVQQIKLKARAECQQDAVRLVQMLNTQTSQSKGRTSVIVPMLSFFEYKPLYPQEDGRTDVELTLHTHYSFDEVLDVILQVPNAHVLYESLNYEDLYTGERWNDIEKYGIIKEIVKHYNADFSFKSLVDGLLLDSKIPLHLSLEAQLLQLTEKQINLLQRRKNEF